MSFVFFNANPAHPGNVDDCMVNAICAVFKISWEEAYMDICLEGLKHRLMPSSKTVWNSYLKSKGFAKMVLPDTCPDCYTVIDFCRDHPTGEYLIALDNHVIAVMHGNYYDTVDTGLEVPVFYWRR